MLLCARVKDCCDEYCDAPDPKNDRVVISHNLMQSKDMSFMLAKANKGEVLVKDVDLKAELKGADVSKEIKMVNSGNVQAVVPKELQHVDDYKLTSEVQEACHSIGPDVEQRRIKESEAESHLVQMMDKMETEARKLEEAKETTACFETADEQARKIKEKEEIEAALDAVEAQELLEAMEASLKHHEGADIHQLDKAKQALLDEERADQVKLEKFLVANNFHDVNAKRTRYMKSSYPLHIAVTQNNADMVQVLLAAGARPTLQNSAKQTPLELAQKLNKKDSHAAVIKFLRFEAGM